MIHNEIQTITVIYIYEVCISSRKNVNANKNTRQCRLSVSIELFNAVLNSFSLV